MQQSSYVNAGGAWENQDIEGAIKVKLDNGVRFNLFPNKYWEEGSTKPKWRISMRREDADALGIVEQERGVKVEAPKEKEVDLADLPF